MRRIYLASSWRNGLQPGLVTTLRSFGHKVYDFRNPPGRTGFQWSDIAPAWESWTTQQYIEALSHPIAQAGFMADYEGMKWADTCVLLLPSGRSAHLEAGWFVGAGRPLHILVLSEEEPELMNKMATSICRSVAELIHRLAEERP